MTRPEWILLVPPHVIVDQRTSGAVSRPVLVTAHQLQTAALLAAKALNDGNPIDIGALIEALARGDTIEVAVIDAGHPNHTTPETDRISWGCECGKMWTTATGGEQALRRHQATCGVHRQASSFPADYRLDQ